MKRLLLTATGLIALSIPAMAQNTEVRVMPDTLIWKDNPAFPKGVQIATFVGDPTKAGEVVAKHAHYAWTGSGEGILQVQFTGPGGYINPTDDPRKQ